MPEILNVAIASARMALAGAAWFVKRPSQRRAHGLEIKRDVDKHLRIPRGGAVDVIVRNEWRIDSYPDDYRVKWFGGPSAWHKAEVVGAYEAGLEVCVGFPSVVIANNRARDAADGEKACAIARIPFDLIGEIDWDGDNYGAYPHVFCRYRFRHGPYEKWLRIRRKTGWSGDQWIEEHGVRYRPRRPRLWSRLKARRAANKAMRDTERRLP